MTAKSCSIVIPAFNEEAAIKDTVRRVLESNPNAEVILLGFWPAWQTHLYWCMLIGSNFLFVLLGIVLVASLFIRRPWCSYLCPLRPVTDLIRLVRNWILELWEKTLPGGERERV